MTTATQDPADPPGFAAQIKFWRDSLTEGLGLLSSLLGGLALIAPWVQPFTPSVLSPFMTVLTVLSFLGLTFWAASLRMAAKGPRRGVAAIFFLSMLAMFFVFLWLLDAAPRWALLHDQPLFVRGLTALPYGLAVGALCAMLVSLAPALPRDPIKTTKNAAA